MKKKLSVLLALSLIFGNTLQASAAELPESELPVNELTTSDAEYEAQIAEILASYDEDPEAAIEALAELDTVLVSAPTVVEHTPSSSSRMTYPSDYDLSVSCVKRTNSNRLYLQWILVTHALEVWTGPLDYISLEWDTDYASYYLASAGGAGCTIQGRDTGIVLFNVEDHRLSTASDKPIYGTVQVTPTTTGWMEFGSKFVHTYTTINVGGSATFSFTPSTAVAAGSSLNLAHTMSFKVDVGSETNQWQLWTDNAVKITEV